MTEVEITAEQAQEFIGGADFFVNVELSDEGPVVTLKVMAKDRKAYWLFTMHSIVNMPEAELETPRDIIED